ncbi:MAG: DUF1178 family protein [Rhodospirillaceae bacterium]|nr:DUF1178 family protein [Rhodospirillaceae bacterium]
MILYDLICENEHEFESWFRNSNAVGRLTKAGQVVCPACGTTKVQKALQAPAIPRKSALKTSLPVPAKAANTAEVAKAMEKMTQAFTELRQTIEKNFENVGDKFPEEARKIHYKEAPERGIYGDASPEQAKDLIEEGIKVYALPWPKRTNS